MQLNIEVRDKDRIVRCLQWKAGFYGDFPVGNVTLNTCAKCRHYKKLTDIFTLEYGFKENK